ncbi:MAG TPA: RNase adapter RapZ [Clostridiales bacterium]|nr:RNase adapter RapZ [Clostridiales bacterium]
MKFIIITGVSGAGKTSALHALEDIYFYCVDNIPPVLISTFYDLCKNSTDSKMQNVAVVTNIRDNKDLTDLILALEKLQSDKAQYKIVFLDAREDVLLTRYKQTRRKHPLSDSYNGSVVSAMHTERELLTKVRERADYIVDSSLSTPLQLKERISSLFLDNDESSLSVTCMSFGFKYGLPTEADLVFDVRCLPNPFYIEDLKHKTGLDQPVYDYVMKWDETHGYIERMLALVDYTLPLYEKEGKSQLVIGIGCTGGKHRSVTLTRVLFTHLIENGQRATTHNRDILKA